MIPWEAMPEEEEDATPGIHLLINIRRPLRQGRHDASLCLQSAASRGSGNPSVLFTLSVLLSKLYSKVNGNSRRAAIKERREGDGAEEAGREGAPRAERRGVAGP